MRRTLRFRGFLDFSSDFECFPRMDNVDNRTRTSRLQVLQKRAGVASVRIGGIDAFGREVVQLLEVRVPATNVC